MVIDTVAKRKEGRRLWNARMCVWLREGFTGKVVFECTLEMLGGERGSGQEGSGGIGRAKPLGLLMMGGSYPKTWAPLGS